MFSFTDKENSKQIQMSHSKQIQQSYTKQRAKEDKEKKISNLRQIYTSVSINWRQPINSFLELLQNHHNQYSLLLTLFQISQDPLWRNRIPHICSLIQRLHNHCADKQGDYLSELAQIPNYHERLCRIFYLNDNQVQEHFKLIITIYLSYNYKLGILDETDIAIGLIHAGRHRSDNKLDEYLWLVCQIRIDKRAIVKLLKYGREMVSQSSKFSQNQHNINESLIPLVTILSNFLNYQNDPNVLDQLIQNEQFQTIFMYSLSQVNYPDLNREALLLCNNLLAKSADLAFKIMSSEPVMKAASILNNQEKQFFLQLTRLRTEERSTRS